MRDFEGQLPGEASMEREERSDSAKHLQLLLDRSVVRRRLWKRPNVAQVRGEVLAGQARGAKNPRDPTARRATRSSATRGTLI